MRLVIKVGTSLIAPGGNIDTQQLRALIDQLDLKRDEILIVSSGAIASGMANLGLREKPASVPLMQACAAVGQSALMHTYEQLFFGKKRVAQLLLSSDDFTSPVRYRRPGGDGRAIPAFLADPHRTSVQSVPERPQPLQP